MTNEQVPSKELVIGDTALLPDETIRRMTLDAGGTFHGPRVEHASIEEQTYFRLMRQAFELGRRSTRRTANEPPAGRGQWEAFSNNDDGDGSIGVRIIGGFAGADEAFEHSEKVAEHLNRAGQPPLPALVQWVKRNADHADDCMGFLAKIEDDGTETPSPCTCGLRELIPDFDEDFSLADNENSGPTKSGEQA